MLDAYNSSTDDLPITLSFGKVLPPNLGPEDLSTMKNFELMSPIDLNFMGDVWTFNNSSMVTISGLNLVNSLIDVGIGVHDLYIYFLLGFVTNKNLYVFTINFPD